MELSKTYILIGVLALLVLIFAIMISSNDKKSAPKKSTQKSTQSPKNTNKNAEIKMYYASWCGASKMFFPEWKRLKELAAKSYPNLTVSEIDCEVNKANMMQCAAKKIKGYPTIMITCDGQDREYAGMRRAEDIIGDALK